MFNQIIKRLFIERPCFEYKNVKQPLSQGISGVPQKESNGISNIRREPATRPSSQGKILSLKQEKRYSFFEINTKGRRFFMGFINNYNSLPRNYTVIYPSSYFANNERETRGKSVNDIVKARRYTVYAEIR
ncbi:hypothetical protein UP17_08830 [Peribacillus simplex]|nr:hypothetical protein UP17_08830 [Peribacillus simplex]